MYRPDAQIISSVAEEPAGGLTVLLLPRPSRAVSRMTWLYCAISERSSEDLFGNPPFYCRASGLRGVISTPSCLGEFFRTIYPKNTKAGAMQAFQHMGWLCSQPKLPIVRP